MARSLIVVMSLLGLVACSPVKVILDTDMSTDCDDVGAVCILNQLADQGEAEILAMVHNTGLKEGIGAVSVLNTFYQRNVPLGAYKGRFDFNLSGRCGSMPNPCTTGRYVDDLVKHYPSPVKSYDDVPNAVDVYRQTLAAQPNRSVTIVSIGFFTNLAALVNSSADKYSPLSGLDLIQQKVAHLAVMGGYYLENGTKPSWNFGYNNIGNATQYVLANWPSDVNVTFLGATLGTKVSTGGVMTSKLNASNPCRQAYIDFNGPGQNRYSWDPMTTLLAVRGTDQFYNTVSGFNQLLSNGFNIWHNVSNTNQRYVNLKVDPSVVANTIDGLLTEAATGHVESLRR